MLLDAPVNNVVSSKTHTHLAQTDPWAPPELIQTNPNPYFWPETSSCSGRVTIRLHSSAVFTEKACSNRLLPIDEVMFHKWNLCLWRSDAALSDSYDQETNTVWGRGGWWWWRYMLSNYSISSKCDGGDDDDVNEYFDEADDEDEEDDRDDRVDGWSVLIKAGQWCHWCSLCVDYVLIHVAAVVEEEDDDDDDKKVMDDDEDEPCALIVQRWPRWPWAIIRSGGFKGPSLSLSLSQIIGSIPVRTCLFFSEAHSFCRCIKVKVFCVSEAH